MLGVGLVLYEMLTSLLDSQYFSNTKLHAMFSVGLTEVLF